MENTLILCGGTGAHVGVAFLRLHTLGYALGFFDQGGKPFEFPKVFLVDQDSGDGNDGEATAWPMKHLSGARCAAQVEIANVFRAKIQSGPRPGAETMAIHSPRRKLTLDDFERFPEDDHQRHEILDGVHVVTAAPFLRHQRVSFLLGRWLAAWAEERALGEVFIAPLGVALSPHDVLEPDLFCVSNERKAILSDKYVQGAPDLVVEILSEGTRRRDLGVKRVRYEALGVAEYWVLDPKRSICHVFRRERQERRQEERFLPPLLLGAEDRLTTPLLPGLEIRLDELFARG